MNLPDLLIDAAKGTLGGPDKADLRRALRGANEDGFAVTFDALLAALRDGPGAEIERLAALVERLKLEAQAHAQEARTQASIVKDCYRAVTGGKGEPGDWHGAKPVQGALDAARAENERLRGILRGIHVYATDTLSGRSKGPEDREWFRCGFEEISARAALAKEDR